MEGLALFFILTTALSVSQAREPLPIHFLRSLSGTGAEHSDGVSCLSWRLAVETHNIREWKTVPESCEDYMGNYMLGNRYRKDSKVVANEATLYAKSLKLGGDGKDVWIFDVDETTLSNLPYYAQHGFGVETYNSTSINEWVYLGKAPALPESLKLYKKLVSLGFKIIFLTGRGEAQRNITVSNLKNVGYHTWERLILKGSSEVGTSLQYKSRQRKVLVEEGYRILGNMGDQWSDLLGRNIGNRTFKVPDPMYYIA
ncbi:acid phosphatase 1-like [Tasmannia lanceolata]|uniref:acid phosphatase 1-like n=1 Tax=Tasmannia lanceolata TaxID=3420 RepID=UPI004064AC3E